jgi:hypothetical protein
MIIAQKLSATQMNRSPTGVHNECLSDYFIALRLLNFNNNQQIAKE